VGFRQDRQRRVSRGCREGEGRVLETHERHFRTDAGKKPRSSQQFARLPVQVRYPEPKIATRKLVADLAKNCGGGAVDRRDRLRVQDEPPGRLRQTIDNLFDARELVRLWRTSRIEFLFALIAMFGVIGFGVLRGVLIAIVAKGVYLLARVSHPSDALLGCIPGRDGFYKLHREPRAKPVPGLAIYLVQASLVFFNIDYVRDRIRWYRARPRR
jgi:hypothetical protein